MVTVVQVVKCEYCSKTYTTRYGSGRFCSEKCARGFSSKDKRLEINKKVSLTLLGHKAWNKKYELMTLRCLSCGKDFKGKNYRKFCSRKCSCKYNNQHVSLRTKNKLSISTKKAYANGKPVYGGTSEWLTVNTSNGVVRVQGTYEERTCKILDKLKENGSISNWEYTKDRYEYIGEDGKLHYYLLDFKIFCGDHFYYVETKGYVKLKDKLKWGAMRSKGVDLDIWFDNELKEYENNLNMVTLV